MTISINKTKLITDLAGNEILNTSIPITLQPYEYITDGIRYIYIYNIYIIYIIY